MMLVTHKICSGPAVEANSLEAEICTFPAENFPFTCFTCLDAILEQTELRICEEFRM